MVRGRAPRGLKHRRRQHRVCLGTGTRPHIVRHSPQHGNRERVAHRTRALDLAAVGREHVGKRLEREGQVGKRDERGFVVHHQRHVASGERMRHGRILGSLIDGETRRGVHLAHAKRCGKRRQALVRRSLQDKQGGPDSLPLGTQPVQGLQQVPHAPWAAARHAGWNPERPCTVSAALACARRRTRARGPCLTRQGMQVCGQHHDARHCPAHRGGSGSHSCVVTQAEIRTVPDKRTGRREHHAHETRIHGGRTRRGWDEAAPHSYSCTLLPVTWPR